MRISRSVMDSIFIRLQKVAAVLLIKLEPDRGAALRQKLLDLSVAGVREYNMCCTLSRIFTICCMKRGCYCLPRSQHLLATAKTPSSCNCWKAVGCICKTNRMQQILKVLDKVQQS